MTVSRKVEREIIRNEFLALVNEFLINHGEEVLRVKSNEIAIPVVGCEGNEDFLVVTFKVPTGANKGLEPYDGYAEAEDYEMKLKSKAEKAKANAEKKAKKMARDAEIRKAKAEKKTEQVFSGQHDRFFIVNRTNNKSITSTAGRPSLRRPNEHTFVQTGRPKFSEYYKFSHLSNFNFALDNPTTMCYNKLGEAQLSEYYELSEFSELSVMYTVYEHTFVDEHTFGI